MEDKSDRLNDSDSSCWDGEFYSIHSEWQFKMAKLALNQIKILKTSHILDIGCGTGRVTKYLADNYSAAQVIGIDPSISMLRETKNYTSQKVAFKLGKAETIDFPNKFDLVTAFNSLHWVKEIDLAISNITNALISKGQALILVVPKQNRSPLHEVINKVIFNTRWHLFFKAKESVFSFFSLAEWANIIEKAGLIPEKLELVNASMHYKSKTIFANSLISWIPFGTIPLDERNKYVNDIVEEYLKQVPLNTNGEIHYLLDELVIVASKPDSFAKK